jgi:hypothetical protein
MTLLLCPDCCQWREPMEGCCTVCAASLDVGIPDPTLETLADELGDWQEWLGDAEVVRAGQSVRGKLAATAWGLLFVPHESRVIVLPPRSQFGSSSSWTARFWSRLTRRAALRFSCESRAGGLPARSRRALAELLLSDPGVVFWSRGAISTWRRQHGRWEFVRANATPWPERIAMRDRDGDRALQTWLESTECPQSVNVR